MKYYETKGFNELLAQAIKENWDSPAMTNYANGTNYTYQRTAEAIACMHLLYQRLGIKENDRIAVVGKNTPEWAVVFLSAVTYGAIIVPILQNFPPDDIHHIVNHSGSKLLFVSDNLKELIVEDNMPNVMCIYCYTEKYCVHKNLKNSIPLKFHELRHLFMETYPNGLDKEKIQYATRKDEDHFSINYTSGTTGFSKGVIQTCGNIRGNIAYVMEVGLAHNQNKVLNFLPLAHTYGCSLDFLSQISNGSHITFLNKVPAPKVLIKAFDEVKPNVIFTVPLIVEKFYRAIAEPVMKKHAGISESILEKDIYPQLKEKLLSVFGGKIKQVVVGGAPLNGEIEENLLKLKFPLAVGYGMTECSPLISFANHDEYRIKAVGKGLPNMEVRIDSEDPLNVAGEIIVKGQNVMPCYFKNEKATEAVFDKEGWFHTGDIGIMKDGYIYIKGRCKSMILGPSGQNIYPEPLEAKMSNMPFVAECLIVEKCGKLVALVYPDIKAMDELNLQKEDLSSIMEENRKKFNNTVANYEQLSEIILYPKEFEKTPKKNIKRYLYENRN